MGLLGRRAPPQARSTCSGVRGAIEEPRLSASEELPQTLTVPRTIALCSGHDADPEDSPVRVESPGVLDLSQEPHNSSFPFSSRWSLGATAPQFSSCSFSASSLGSSLQHHQKQAEPQGCSLARVSSSLELTVPQSPPSTVGPGSQYHCSPQSVLSRGDAPGLGRRHLSIQAEYWACVLPDSLPPSPDRHSPLWNPNKEYEDLLDYTYPLRPRPHLPKHLKSHMLADPVLQDSGIDLDSFSASPTSTLKSPTNVSHGCPPAEATSLPFSGVTELGLKWRPFRVPPKQSTVELASCSQLTSTPRTSGSKDTSGSQEPSLRGMKDWLPMGKQAKASPSRVRTCNRGWPSSRPGGEKGASQNIQHPACRNSEWKSEEEVESDDEYLTLPTRLTQVSSLVSYLGSLPTASAEGHSSLDMSDSDGPASLPSDSSQSQLPPGASFRGPKDAVGQNPRFLSPFIRAEDSAEKGNLVTSQVLGVSCGLLRTQSSLPALLKQQEFLDPDAGRQPPRKNREQGKESLIQCVKTFCCQLEELILWLYNVADVTNHLTSPKSNLTGVKSSLQLYRQFKKDINEHQFLTESVLQKGEILLQCLLDNTPVLKDVLGRISKQPSELENHADHLYDSILTSLDVLAGCTLPANTPLARRSTGVKGFTLTSSQTEI
ncbi:centrosomal protein of 68 kDa isoform X2 [Erinaceus europaeus]|uniref:Centrosomal protein of 68 kDa isoform X2 n=1 Tax=Erinaceus europaeus TaxID=9365 RepID=A0ABM3X2Y1_ERIEU|nr:centrosomal protein of 68 kDa isoform X2 [Erinaceus europaeus]